MKLKYRYNKAEFEVQLREEAELNERISINIANIILDE